MKTLNKTIISLVTILFLLAGNVHADKIKIGTEGAYPYGIQKMLQVN